MLAHLPWAYTLEDISKTGETMQAIENFYLGREEKKLKWKQAHKESGNLKSQKINQSGGD